jgi:V8-like Glu-specific endopeptidase
VETLEGRLLLALSAVPRDPPYPYSAVVELRATYPTGKVFVGSGVLIDRFHVLTAGHVLYNAQAGGYATMIQATPALDGNHAPHGSAWMTRGRTYSTWLQYSRTHPGGTGPGAYDIALLTLNQTIGDRTGAMAYGYNNNAAFFRRGTIMATAGYPAAGGYDGLRMKYSAGPITGLSRDGSLIQYRQWAITTFAGSSGSPVYRYININRSGLKPVVYGVVAGGSGLANSLNIATRITQRIFNDLGRWRGLDAVPPIQTVGKNTVALATPRPARFANQVVTTAPRIVEGARFATVYLSTASPGSLGGPRRSIV